jgi:YVTN family beta-propeller protein
MYCIMRNGSMSRLRRAGLISSLAMAACVVAPPLVRAAGLIYVSTEEGGEVVVIDPVKAAIVTRIPVGKRPRGVKLSPDGKRLYVALSGSPRAAPGSDESKLPPADRAADGVGVIDLETHKLLRTLGSGQDPESFDVSRDGKTLYVSNEESAEMTVLDLVTGKVKKKVAVGKEPEGVTLRPDGKVVYVTSEEENVVVAVSTDKLKVLARITTGPRPRSIAFSRDGGTGFVTNENGAQVTVFDAVKNVATGSIKIEARTKTPLGPRPMGTALSPDGNWLYVSCGRGESVAVIDVAKREVARLVDGIGARPWGIGVSADGKAIYTANGPSNDVSLTDAATGKVTARVKIGGLPWGLVVAR